MVKLREYALSFTVRRASLPRKALSLAAAVM
jgi:hypothetical protein